MALLETICGDHRCLFGPNTSQANTSNYTLYLCSHLYLNPSELTLSTETSVQFDHLASTRAPDQIISLQCMPHDTISSLVQTPPNYLHWTVFVLPCPTQCQLSWYLPHFLPSHHLLSFAWIPQLLCPSALTSCPLCPQYFSFSSLHGCLMSRLFGSWIMYPFTQLSSCSAYSLHNIYKTL